MDFGTKMPITNYFSGENKTQNDKTDQQSVHNREYHKAAGAVSRAESRGGLFTTDTKAWTSRGATARPQADMRRESHGQKTRAPQERPGTVPRTERGCRMKTST